MTRSPQAANIMQRVFDTLNSSPEMLTKGEVAMMLHITDEMVTHAIYRLAKHRCIRTQYDGHERTFGIRNGAERPVDDRGRKRK